MITSVFLLPGPIFLLVYAGLFFTLWGLINFFRYRRDTQYVTDFSLDDPYEVALLNDGPPAAIATAIVSLIDREILEVPGERQIAAKKEALSQVRKPIEKAILKAASPATSIEDLVKSSELKSACDAYEFNLCRQRLLYDQTTRNLQGWVGAFATTIFFSTGFIKLMMAIKTNHSNVSFLIAGGSIGCIILLNDMRRRRSILGDRAIADLKDLFYRLSEKSSYAPGGSSNEVAWTAALFGLRILNSQGFSHVPLLFPKASGKSSSSSGGTSYGCATSCSSSCSGGSSCGGGGCGGGCGGCGGS